MSPLGERLATLDHALQYGPGIRAQRLVEASFLVAAFFSGDVRLAYPTLALATLQAISPRLVPVAWGLAALMPLREPRPTDLYFDLRGSQGACAASAVVMCTGIALVHAGSPAWGFLVLAMPTASFLLAPTVGFCTGCAVYVACRELGAWLGAVRRLPDGACDVVVGSTTSPREAEATRRP